MPFTTCKKPCDAIAGLLGSRIHFATKLQFFSTGFYCRMIMSGTESGFDRAGNSRIKKTEIVAGEDPAASLATHFIKSAP